MAIFGCKKYYLCSEMNKVEMVVMRVSDICLAESKPEQLRSGGQKVLGLLFNGIQLNPSFVVVVFFLQHQVHCSFF